MADSRWYAAGLRFECTQCGNCCRNHGEYHYVHLTQIELDQIPKFLGISRRDFLKRYCTKEPHSFVTLRMDTPACPFLNEKQQCSIYPVRPMQCRTWPFWEHNLTEAQWNGPVKDCCPGIGKGTLYPADEVDRIARETERWFDV